VDECKFLAFGLPRLPKSADPRRLMLKDYCTSVRRLVWAKANGCCWHVPYWREDYKIYPPSLSYVNPCALAAGGGHLETLQWARHGTDIRCAWDEATCWHAAKGGHLAVLQWARQQDPPCPWDARTCAEAAGTGQLEAGPYTHPLLSST
jgi:hypothetical protein